MLRLTFLLIGILTSPAHAVVIRHDVDDANYRIAASEFPALVDMPYEGHGVLIAPQWVVTAAHTVPTGSSLKKVVINGEARDVERVIIHPGYRPPPQHLIDQTMATGEAVLILAHLAASDDIALIELKEPVQDVEPVELYQGNDEFGQNVKFIGKGATGTATEGHSPSGPNRTELRQGYNKVTSANNQWFCYQFDDGPAALPLEAVTGNGDSGGPVLIENDGNWVLAGMMSWKLVNGDVRTTRPGQYGQVNCNVRLSHYRAWIESEIVAITSDR